ncbi:DUF881 domain-containing protein [Desulfolucanica intricata]|uniref:DUF881 domain-containing protein n=1 Tax=Desulfolucanica intricata TaxID=1285191 RepID=UPI0008328B75|nr:DUF881 domain-containing protein [Desulfolucanica intricata]
MKKTSFQWVILLVGLIMGLMLSMQFRVTEEVKHNVQVQRAQELITQLEKIREERDKLKEKEEKLRDELDQAVAGPQISDLKKKIETARIEAGVTEVTGPGVEVTLNDSNVALQPGENPNLYVIHDEDVLRVLNELKAAGAEAISINGQRLLATSEIRCVGPAILVNKSKHLAPPFVISAIGDPETMESALKMRNGVIESLKVWGIQVDVKKQDRMTIPPYSGAVSFEFAQPVSDQTGGQVIG